MELYAFGSLTSGEVDQGSDADVLVILEPHDTPMTFPPSWSVYSLKRLADLYDRGTLFAWHLHRDAVKLWPRDTEGLLRSLPGPARYTNAASEIDGLLRIATDSVDEIQRGSSSMVFELGLLFLTSRDIAMSAASHVLGDFSFSRFAPLMYTAPRFPMTRQEYSLLMQCRRCTTRGESVLETDAHCASNAIRARGSDLLQWMRQLRKMVPNG